MFLCRLDGRVAELALDVDQGQGDPGPDRGPPFDLRNPRDLIIVVVAVLVFVAAAVWLLVIRAAGIAFQSESGGCVALTPGWVVLWVPHE